MDELGEAAVLLFEALDEGAVVLDVIDERDDLRVVAANRAVAGELGDPAALVGRLGSELYPPAELADVVRRARETLAAGEPTRYRAVRELPQGRLVVEATIVPVGPSRVITYGRDVSAEVEAASQLEQLESLAQIGSWHWNLDDGSFRLSAEYRRILGWGSDDPVTVETIAQAIHPDDRERVLERMQLTSTGRDEVRGATYRIVRPDGEERVVHGTGELVVDGEGRPIRMFGTTQDITARANAEEDRRRLDRALERHQRALELNDNVVQGLSSAWLAFDLGEIDEGIALVRRTTRDAQNLVNAMLHEAAADEPLAPGDLARRVPANAEHPEAG